MIGLLQPQTLKALHLVTLDEFCFEILGKLPSYVRGLDLAAAIMRWLYWLSNFDYITRVARITPKHTKQPIYLSNESLNTDSEGNIFLLFRHIFQGGPCVQIIKL